MLPSTECFLDSDPLAREVARVTDAREEENKLAY